MSEGGAERLVLTAPPGLPFTPISILAGLLAVAIGAHAMDAWPAEQTTLPLAVGLVLLLALRAPRRVFAGPEGFEIVGVLRRRVVPFRDVRRARPEASSVVLTFATGEELVLERASREDADPREVLDRMWTSLAAGAEQGVRANEAAALSRGDRRPRAWIRALCALAAGSAYRQGLVPRERLGAIVENPAVEPELRAAAAVALASRDDEEARARLERVLATTIDPRLRQALAEIAAAREEGDLERALGRMTLHD